MPSLVNIPKNFTAYFGPPGTGKTTTLSHLVCHYAEEEGSDSLLLTSFTKAAAQELAGRDLALTPGSIGTLHSHCYRALDHPTIAESKAKDWNIAFPHYPMSVSHASSVQDSASAGKQSLPDEHDTRQQDLLGDTLLAALNYARSSLRPVPAGDGALGLFVRHWCDWKAQYGYLDFTDLLEQGVKLLRVAPGNPRTLIVDEAQDLTPLQWKLVAQWSQHTTRTIAGGDDDQCLYQWCAADPTPLLAAPSTSKHVLPKSYRLPIAIYDYAQQYLNAIETREPKTWSSNGLPGLQTHATYSWERPSTMLPLIEATLSVGWETCMVLAPCGYMLDPLVRFLRAEGIPFGNPWRRRRGDWNPLHYGGRGMSSVARLRDFLRPRARLWTWAELASWGVMLRQRGNMLPGATTLLTLHGDETTVCSLDMLTQIFTPAALQGALQGGLQWLEGCLLKRFAAAMAFPLRVYKRYGRAALAADPRIIVGTCHSVKGGEADRVILFTELSRMFQQARALGGDAADSVERMLYVGATRAREELYVV